MRRVRKIVHGEDESFRETAVTLLMLQGIAPDLFEDLFV